MFNTNKRWFYDLAIIAVVIGLLIMAVMKPSNSSRDTSTDTADVSWQAQSVEKHFVVSLSPQDSTYQIGNFHNWIATVKNKEGKPVSGLLIGVSGGMKAHGHGLPSRPIVKRYLGDGQYLIEGMMFNMSGDWTLVLSFQNDAVRDSAVFEIQLDF